jgi:hypothetical protein
MPFEESMPSSRLRAILYTVARSRLLHFLFLGGAIFAMTQGSESNRRIDIDSRRVVALRRSESPAAADRKSAAAELVARQVEDELLLREAERLGLDRDDEIIRRRLIQKTLLLAEDLGGASRVPTEEDLRSYFMANKSRYTLPEQLRFVFVAATTRERAESLRAPLSQLPKSDPEAPALGDPVPVSRHVIATLDEVAASFGVAFAAALSKLPVDTWSPPLESRYGWNLVLIKERKPARPATFEDVRATLPLDYLTTRRAEAITQFLRQALRRHPVKVDGRELFTLPASSRTALHAQDSAED